jgi:hypothetical protein
MLPAFGFAPVRGWGRGWRVSPLPKLPAGALKPVDAAAILAPFHTSASTPFISKATGLLMVAVGGIRGAPSAVLHHVDHHFAEHPAPSAS